MERWVGKLAVVTGASSGIGAALVKKLVQAGVKVAGVARRKDRIEEIARKLEPGQLFAYKADVSNEDEVVETFASIEKTLGPVHILVNCAGVVRDTSLIDGNSELWKEMINTNFFGLCVATREAVRAMRRNNVAGHIVHINSILGHIVADLPGFNVYTGTKFGVTALTEVLRKELLAIESPIKITSVSPGAVDTEFPDTSDDITSMFKKIALLQPEAVADAVMYTLGTPPQVQVHEIIIKAQGERL